MVRRWTILSLAAGVLITAAPPMAGASEAGRRNTAIAVTGVAVGAWANGTGRAGRRNTAILTTAGAAIAWSRVKAKKKHRRPQRVVVLAANDCRREKCYYKHDNGLHLGQYKCRGRFKQDGRGYGQWKHGRDD